MAAGIPNYWPLMEAYHRAREPLYRRIILDARLADDGAILDAGCGDGFYSRLLAEAGGPNTQIVALDMNASLLARCPASNVVQRCMSDLERAGLTLEAFDAVWLCRALHSSLDPRGRLASLGLLLRPGRPAGRLGNCSRIGRGNGCGLSFRRKIVRLIPPPSIPPLPTTG